MELIHDIPTRLPHPSAATIGFFDGVHGGHRYLLAQVKEEAARRGLSVSVVTFPVSPAQVMRPERALPLLTTPFEKLELLEQAGVDTCVLLPFTPALAALTAREFMQRLHDEYRVEVLVIGYDHRFGHHRSEGFEDYVRYGQEIGIEVIRAKEYFVGTQDLASALTAQPSHVSAPTARPSHVSAPIAQPSHVSSSTIRQHLTEGRIEAANALLGYPYFIEGIVTEGYQVGRRLGYPTANLLPNSPEKLVPADGVYAVRVRLQGTSYNGILNIGNRPTLDNGDDRSIEVHILAFQGDIYAQPLRIEFLHYLRGEQKFASVEELVSQIKQDQVEASRYF